MAVCINDILEPDLSLPPSDSPETSVGNFGLYNKQGEFTYDLQFIDAINNATKNLAGINCSKEVNDYLRKQLDKLKSKSGSIVSGTIIESAINTISDVTHDVANFVRKTEKNINALEKKLCTVIVPFFKTLTTLIDIATKLLPILYKKIQKLRAKLQAALADFTNTVKSCMIQVVSDLKTSLDIKIKNAIAPTIDSTLALMRACPCATEIIGSMFGCNRDSNGNKITDPDDVYACIKNKYAFLDPSIIVDAYNNVVTKYLVNNIKAAFTFIDNLIKNILQLLMLPIRELMRIYGKILNQKIDMSFLLDAIGPFECLFSYTTEHDGAGLSFKGMSVIDMINTIKKWSSCFDQVCSSLITDSDDYLKTLNQSLHLDERFWRDANIIDLYQSTIGYKLQAYPPSALMLRKLFITNNTNGKGTFVDIIDVFKQIGTMSAQNVTFNNPFAKSPTQKSAVVFSTNNEKESPNTSNGLAELTTGIEKRLMQMETTLASDSDAYYVAKFNELISFETSFAKSDAHNTQIETLFNAQIQINSNYTGSGIIMEPLVVRQPYSGIEPLPTYVISNDYNQTEADKIENSTLPERNVNENLVDYYKRCFSVIS